MSNIVDFEMDQGTTYTRRFTLKNEDGTPFDLTGFDARMQVRKSYGAPGSPLINCTTQNGKLVLSPGMVTLHLAPGDTEPIKFASAEDASLETVYDLEIISPDMQVVRPAKGTLTLNREVTR